MQSRFLVAGLIVLSLGLEGCCSPCSCRNAQPPRRERGPKFFIDPPKPPQSRDPGSCHNADPYRFLGFTFAAPLRDQIRGVSILGFENAWQGVGGHVVHTPTGPTGAPCMPWAFDEPVHPLNHPVSLSSSDGGATWNLPCGWTGQCTLYRPTGVQARLLIVNSTTNQIEPHEIWIRVKGPQNEIDRTLRSLERVGLGLNASQQLGVNAGQSSIVERTYDPSAPANVDASCEDRLAPSGQDLELTP